MFIQTVSVFGNIAGSLLTGQLDYHQTEIYTNADGSTAFQPTRASDTEQSITPTAEAQMGLRYMALHGIHKNRRYYVGGRL